METCFIVNIAIVFPGDLVEEYLSKGKLIEIGLLQHVLSIKQLYIAYIYTLRFRHDLLPMSCLLWAHSRLVV